MARPHNELSVSLIPSSLGVNTKSFVLIGHDGTESSVSEHESLRVVRASSPLSCDDSSASLVISKLNGEVVATMPGGSQCTLGTVEVPNLLAVVLHWGLKDSSVLCSANVVHDSHNSSSSHLASNSDSFVVLETSILWSAWLVSNSPLLVFAVVTSPVSDDIVL